MTNLDTNLYDEDRRKLLSAVSHGSIFLSPLMLSVGIPITLLFISEDPVVRDNAKESINYHLNLWIYQIVFGVVSFFWWTIILLPAIWLMGGFVFVITWVMPVLAILSCLKMTSSAYRYPFIFRIV